ncbi:hypothetical protein AB0C02_02965 [Micromonospora sp. NPDC048999]|uniref:LppU/SCO3897 family protein n=1 Tax=Micromonospora sp. NPDC048999 TaxID=3155391 RepID=UPI0033F3F8B6
MTSEAPHRPGHEPGEVSPGAGGPAPYGDRPAQQDNGYPGAADLGWAPPPPAGAPTQPAPAWGQPGDQPVAGRAAAQVPPGDPGAWGGSPQPAWTPPEQAGAAWGAPEQEAPAWAAAPPASFGEPAPPAWAAAPTNVSAEPGPPAWPAPTEQNGPGWNTGHGEQPAWAQPGESSARAAAPVPAPAVVPNESWATGQQDGADPAGGWQNGQQIDDQPAWGQQGAASAPAWAPAEATARASAKVSVPGPPADNWPAQDNPDRSGGWAAGRAAGQAEAPVQAGPGHAAVPTAGDRPESGAWNPARASVSMPTPESSTAWGDNQDSSGQWAPEHPALPEAEPWAPGEAWGQPAETEPGESASNGRGPARAEETPLYQPAPGPGISPANAVPLPPQEQRVPGAALAASLPADYLPPAQFAPAAEPADRAYEPEQAAWGAVEPAHEEPQSPAGPMVPGPRTSPESSAAGAVSASASVPMTSRLTPPADQSLPAGGVPAPQPRVYGRPARPESEDFPGQDAPNGFPEQGPRFDEPAPQPRFDEPDRSAAPNAFAEAPPAPSSPAGPPPFPPGVPTFVDPVGSNRPVNGVHPPSDERPGDPFGTPGTRPDPFGPPGGHPDQFGPPGGHPDQFGAPGTRPDPFGGPAGGRASVAVPGQGAMGEPGQGNVPPAFPPAFPPPAPPAWSQGPASESEQGRFDAFKPEAEPQAEAPTPKVRNGRVLAAVLVVAVLILAVPLGLLTLLGKIGGGGNTPAAFDPAVGSCVKQSGASAVAADCGEPDAFTVVSKVDSKDKCADTTQPTVELSGVEGDRLLCLKPAEK